MFGKWIDTKQGNNTSGKSQPGDRNLHSRHQGESKLTKGGHFEHQACIWLEQQGLELLQRNYSCRYGEIDMIMKDQQQLVFVEVRYRKHIQYGGAVASVDWRKQKKILKTAAFFLAKGGKFTNLSCRFDVVAAQANPNNAKLYWTWIKNAFTNDQY